MYWSTTISGYSLTNVVDYNGQLYIKKKKDNISYYCFTKATPWSLVVSPNFHTLIAVRVKYSGEDVKHHTNNGLLRLKIKKNRYVNNRTPSCTETSCEHWKIYWYNYTFYVKDRYSYSTRSNDDLALIDDTISRLTFSSG